MTSDRNNAAKLGDRTYQPSENQAEDAVSKGLAETHEQVSDVYTAGTSDGVTDLADGKVRLLSAKAAGIEERDGDAPQS